MSLTGKTLAHTWLKLGARKKTFMCQNHGPQCHFLKWPAKNWALFRGWNVHIWWPAHRKTIKPMKLRRKLDRKTWNPLQNANRHMIHKHQKGSAATFNYPAHGLRINTSTKRPTGKDGVSKWTLAFGYQSVCRLGKIHARKVLTRKKKIMFKLNQQQLHVGETWAACNSVMRNHDAQHCQLELLERYSRNFLRPASVISNPDSCDPLRSKRATWLTMLGTSLAWKAIAKLYIWRGEGLPSYWGVTPA